MKVNMLPTQLLPGTLFSYVNGPKDGVCMAGVVAKLGAPPAKYATHVVSLSDGVIYPDGHGMLAFNHLDIHSPPGGG